ncbi:MAG: hypothetical protein OEV20_07890 [Actinomycetota bacterium]|nr:hypothetical protein [Actinomycetota bacterium]
MNRIVRRVVNRVMGAFVGAGVGLDDDGRLHLPDGLTADRVHRFIEVCTDRRYDSPREAMHTLFAQIGVSMHAVSLLDRVIDESGDVDFGRASRSGPALLAALPEFHQIPELFRRFLIDDLALAPAECETLAEAVAATRMAAAKRVGCDPSWDAILDHADALGELARPWREQTDQLRRSA